MSGSNATIRGLASPSAGGKEINKEGYELEEENEASEPNKPSAPTESEDDIGATIRGMASPSEESTEDQSWTDELEEWNQMLDCMGEDPCKILEKIKRKRKTSTLQNTMDKLGLKWEEPVQQNKRENGIKTKTKQVAYVNIATNTKCNTFRMVVAIGDRKLDEIVSHLRKKGLRLLTSLQ